MALDDKFFPCDGSLINKFDNFAIRQVSRLGSAYQEMTGESYRDLTKSLYKTGRNISAASIPINPILGFYVSRDCHRASKNIKFETPIEEELRYETAGNPKHIGRYFRLLSPLMGASLTGFGMYCMDYSTQPIDFYGGIGMIMTGLSLAPVAIADYLKKSNLPKPPRETIPQKIKDKLAHIFGKPVAQPLPA